MRARSSLDDTVAATVHAELTLLYWQIGRRISDGVLGGARAEYGQQVLAALARQLTAAYGRGWSEKQLRHCVRAAEVFPDEEILSALRRELSWTHLKTLMYIDDPLRRDYYIELCRLERWSSRQLHERIQSMLFERSALSRKPADVIRHELSQLKETQELTPEVVLKDPYVLDFLGLNDRYLERDLEDAILREMERFLLELGAGFTFVARQKRLQIDDDDFYLDSAVLQPKASAPRCDRTQAVVLPGRYSENVGSGSRSGNNVPISQN